MLGKQHSGQRGIKINMLMPDRWEEISNQQSYVSNTVKSVTSGMLKDVEVWLNKPMHEIAKPVNKAQTAVKEVSNTVQKAIDYVSEGLNYSVEDVIAMAKKDVIEVYADITEAVGKVLAPVSKVVKDTSESFSSGYTKATSYVENYIGDVKQDLKDFGERMKQGIITGLEGIGDKVTDVWFKTVKFLEGIGDKVIESSKDIWNKVQGVLANMLKPIEEWLTNLGDAVVSVLCDISIAIVNLFEIKEEDVENQIQQFYAMYMRMQNKVLQNAED